MSFINPEGKRKRRIFHSTYITGAQILKYLNLVKTYIHKHHKKIEEFPTGIIW